jgi:hypothetical protein
MVAIDKNLRVVSDIIRSSPAILSVNQREAMRLKYLDRQISDQVSSILPFFPG